MKNKITKKKKKKKKRRRRRRRKRKEEEEKRREEEDISEKDCQKRISMHLTFINKLSSGYSYPHKYPLQNT